jgi:hypothetical protein
VKPKNNERLKSNAKNKISQADTTQKKFSSVIQKLLNVAKAKSIFKIEKVTT